MKEANRKQLNTNILAILGCPNTSRKQAKFGRRGECKLYLRFSLKIGFKLTLHEFVT